VGQKSYTHEAGGKIYNSLKLPMLKGLSWEEQQQGETLQKDQRKTNDGGPFQLLTTVGMQKSCTRWAKSFCGQTNGRRCAEEHLKPGSVIRQNGSQKEKQGGCYVF